MKIIKIALVVLAFTVCLPAFQPPAEASTGFYLNFAVAHPGYAYYHHYPYYRHYSYYRPYSYPYWGWGWGWGYPGYAYYPYPTVYYQGYGEVQTEVKPQTAKVFVNGDYVGVTDDYDGWWQRLTIGPGKHRLVFRAPGFKPYVVDLRVLPGSNYHLKYKMEPGEDVIPDAEMLPERDYREQRYRDEGRNPDEDRYRDRDRDRSTDRDRNWDPRRPSERNPYPPSPDQSRADKRELTLSVQPSDATIYVDGNYFGTGDSGAARIMLSDGTHRIEVVRPGYESFEKDILVSENSTPSMTILLQKK